jgi:beta-glucosidase/6-phospho-beta-glucosidase/beta-galactosidase
MGFGVGSASYQIEGGVYQDGIAPSVWHVHTHKPASVANGDVAPAYPRSERQ